MSNTYKKNATLILSFSVLVLCLLLILLCVNMQPTYASDNSESIDILCAKFTESNQGYFNSDKKLQDYENYIDNRFSVGTHHNNHNMDTTLTDDWIMDFVPQRLFDEKKTNYFYLGKEYGFYFNYKVESDTYFIYLMEHSIINEKSGHLVRKITPLYYELYKYNSETGKARLLYKNVSIPTPPTFVDTYFYQKYSEVKKVYLKDVTFTGHLFNETHENDGENNYRAEEDNGAYFIGGSYVFKGLSTVSHKFDFAANIYKIAFGYLPLSQNFMIGDAMNVMDLVTASQDFATTASQDFRNIVTNEHENTFTMKEIQRESQIDHYKGHLLKNYIGELKTPDDSKGILYGIHNGCYAQNTSFFSYAQDNEKWDTLFTGRVQLDVVEEGLVETHTTKIATIESNTIAYQLAGNEIRKISLGAESQIYAFGQKGINFQFTAPQNGDYTFETFGNVKNDFQANKGDKTTKDDMLNEVLKVSLKEGEIFEFSTKNISDSIGRYQIRVSFTPQIIFWGDNNVDLKYDKTFIRFTSPKNLNYRFTLDNNADVLHLLNSNFEVVQTSAAGELLAILNANETYYLRIDRSGSETKTVNLTVKDEMHVFFENIEGITSEIPEKITISSTGSVSLPTPEKRGYTFEGWWTNLDAYGENVTNDNISDYLRPELHLSAKWTPIHYTIFYDENGGDTIPDGDYIIEHVVTLNQNITKSGFVFCGWYDTPHSAARKLKRFRQETSGIKRFTQNGSKKSLQLVST